MSHECFECGKVFTRQYNRDKHFKSKHIKKSKFVGRKLKCPFCAQRGIKKNFQKKDLLVQHVDKEHLNSLIYKLQKSAFNGRIRRFSKQLVTLQSLEKFISDRKI